MSVLYSNKYVNERFEKENSQGRSPNYSPSHTTSSITESFDIIIYYNVHNILLYYILYYIIIFCRNYIALHIFRYSRPLSCFLNYNSSIFWYRLTKKKERGRFLVRWGKSSTGLDKARHPCLWWFWFYTTPVAFNTKIMDSAQALLFYSTPVCLLPIVLQNSLH